ncbi:MAG: hypothetical protein AABY03_00665 [Nanoarchaeota archaeon]
MVSKKTKIPDEFREEADVLYDLGVNGDEINLLAKMKSKRRED